MAEDSWNRIAEGTGFKTLEDPKLCANNCGFFGSPANMNLCSKCYGDFQMEQSAKSLLEKSQSQSQSQSLNAINPNPRMEDLGSSSETIEVTRQSPLPSSSSAGVSPENGNRNRCLSCKKRVGLTGFTCRCGSTFCSFHRYPERHECGFDFKAAGREAIAKANPVIKTDKVQKI